MLVWEVIESLHGGTRFFSPEEVLEQAVYGLKRFSKIESLFYHVAGASEIDLKS